jgi:membrane protease YdiL (CAAX protease family)
VNYWQELLDTAPAYGIVAGVGGLGVVLLAMLTPALRGRWLPLVRIRPISWKGIDVIIAFFLVNAVPGLVAERLRASGFFYWLYEGEEGPAMRGREMLWTAPLAVPLVLGLVFLGLQLLRGTRMAEVGLSPVSAGVNVTLGYGLWLLLTPLVLVIHTVALQLTPGEWVEKHVLDQMAEQGMAISEWVLMLLLAVVLAPLLEEILFRGLLLPWQLRRGWEAQATIGFCTLLFAGLLGARVQGEQLSYNTGPVLFALIMLPGAFVVSSWSGRRRGAAGAQTETDALVPPVENVMAPPRLAAGDKLGEVRPLETIADKVAKVLARAGQARAQPALAVYTNGLFFAVLHADAWPTPIPLAVLGIALAWLRYRTSSLLGPLTVHALFNAVATLSLML